MARLGLLSGLLPSWAFFPSWAFQSVVVGWLVSGLLFALCAYVRACVCARVRVYTCAYACGHVHVGAWICAYTCVQSCIHTRTFALPKTPMRGYVKNAHEA